MITIKIDNKLFSVKNLWSEITIADAKKIEDVNIPETLLRLYDAMTEAEVKAAVKASKESPDPEGELNFFREVIVALSDTDPKILNQTTEGFEHIYFGYLEKFVIDLHQVFPSSYKADGINSFIHRDVKYFLPKAEELINDVKPFAQETVEGFLEGLELKSAMQNKVIRSEGLAGLAAVFAREKGVDYDEKETIARVKAFEDLPMSYVWEVFFCLHTLFNGSVASIHQYFRKEKAGKGMI